MIIFLFPFSWGRNKTETQRFQPPPQANPDGWHNDLSGITKHDENDLPNRMTPPR